MLVDAGRCNTRFALSVPFSASRVGAMPSYFSVQELLRRSVKARALVGARMEWLLYRQASAAIAPASVRKHCKVRRSGHCTTRERRIAPTTVRGIAHSVNGHCTDQRQYAETPGQRWEPGASLACWPRMPAQSQLTRALSLSLVVLVPRASLRHRPGQ